MTQTQQVTRWVGAAALVVGVIGIGQVLPIARWSAEATDAVRGLGGWGLAAFACVYAVATVLLLPASPLTLAAGAAWGPVWATLAVVPGAVMGAVGAFGLGRTLLRHRAEAWIAEDARWKAVDAAIAAQGPRIVFLLRLSPVFPFSLLNVGLGATRVSPWSYTWATALGIVPGTVMYVVAGSALGDVGAVASGARPDLGAAGLALTGLGLLATVAVTVAVTRVAHRALTEALPDAVKDVP